MVVSPRLPLKQIFSGVLSIAHRTLLKLRPTPGLDELVTSDRPPTRIARRKWTILGDGVDDADPSP